MNTLAVKDRIALAIALGGLVGLSWWYLIQMASHMSSGEMSGGDMKMRLGVEPWGSADFFSMFLMWAVMMVATAFRSILIFTAITQQQKRRGRPFVSSL